MAWSQQHATAWLARRMLPWQQGGSKLPVWGQSSCHNSNKSSSSTHEVLVFWGAS